jgi:hypothetical protein
LLEEAEAEPEKSAPATMQRHSKGAERTEVSVTLAAARRHQ